VALRFETPRLIGIAATPALARADAGDTAAFVRLLDAQVPGSWPIEMMADVREHFAHQLETGALSPGWAMWYLVGPRAQPPRRLVGVVGFYGRPDADGTATLGYGIAPGDEGHGFATEAVAGLMAWGRDQCGVTAFSATTFEFHHASVRVLEKNGFACAGVSPDDAHAPDSDRQGRGRLMVWRRAALPA
jgi:RimJ/RimL family protein N-acetyltransferase